MTNASFPVSAWHDGNGSYGLRVGKHRDDNFDQAWKSVVLELAGQDASFEATLTESFWRTCCEIRHRSIASWFEELGLKKWRYKKPPKFTMICLGENRFHVSYP